MGNWGISPNATPKEKLKSEMADFLHGLNSTGEINISTYDEMFDFSMDLLDKMYDLGCANAKTSTHKEKCMACYGSGWYDNCDKKGNPIPCGACNGTGYED